MQGTPWIRVSLCVFVCLLINSARHAEAAVDIDARASEPGLVAATANDAEPLPLLRISYPAPGTEYVYGSPVNIYAVSSNGVFEVVSFFADELKVGEAPGPSITPAPSAKEYRAIWTNAPVGEHILKVVGSTASTTVTSAPVLIHVLEPAKTNWPTIHIVSPTTNSIIHGGQHVPIVIEAFDADDNIRMITVNALGLSFQTNFATSPVGTYRFTLDWVPQIATRTTITAGVYDRVGYKSSASVLVTILPPEPMVKRDLPDYYTAGVSFMVSLNAAPGTNVNAWAVEENPPSLWLVSDVGGGGIYDSASGTVRWGPFTDRQPRTLTYSVRPRTNAFGIKDFVGSFSVNGVSQRIGGDTNISNISPNHPADITQRDFRISMNEATAYAAAWKTQTNWPVGPNPIPVSYVTRAGLIWRSGEHYTFNQRLEAPFCWVPTNSTLKGALVEGTSGAQRVLAPAFTAGHATTVTINASPAADVQSYAVEDQAPNGWTILDAGQGTAVGTVVRFGPFYDSQARSFSYTVIPVSAAEAKFAGVVSFDGSNDSVAGAQMIAPPSTMAEHRDGHVYLRFSATPGELFILESADAIDSVTWNFEATVQGVDTAVALPPIEPTGSLKFYRLRPAGE